MNSYLKTLCTLLLSFALAHTDSFAQTDGSARMAVTINDYNGSGATHWTVAWVTTQSGAFVKTLRKQGTSYSFTSSQWTTHCPQWNAARGGTSGSTVVDGYTSATATSYAGTNSPVILTWNCRDTNNVLVPDGNYKFWVQYAEDSGAGPYTTNGLLWTKGPTGVTNSYANQSPNFTSMQVAWVPNTPPPTAPTITSTPPPAGTVGVLYSYTCAANGTPAPKFTATGLPTGLTMSINGLISGTPTTAGTFPGTITATNGTLPNAAQAFSILISEPGNAYVGSAVCADCHSDKYALLQQSIHSKMIRVDAHLPGVIHGDLRKPNAPATNNVNWVMGGWSKEENYVRTNWTGSNWTYTVTEFKWDPIAGTYANDQSLRDWTGQCAGCHTTGYNPATRNWSELNVGCESCHGPGGDHVADGGDTVFPVIDRSAENCGQCHIRADSVAMGSFTNRQFNFPIGYMAGEPNTLQFIPEPLSATNSFFPNGTSKQHRQQYLDMHHPDKTPTKHYQQGVSCTTCHDPHTAGIVSTYAGGLPANTFGIKIYDNVANVTNYVAWDGGRLWNPTNHTAIAQANRSDLCKACHATVTDHHVHQFNATALAANVTCADCHMPDVINVDPTTLRGALHPHTFAAIKPEDSMKYGPTIQPNSCTYRCHQVQGATVAERAAWADSILTQRMAPLVSSGHLSGVRVVGTPQYQYAIQVSSNLTSWVYLTTNTAAPLLNAAPRWGFEFLEPVSDAAQRFYRSKQILPSP